MKNPLLILLASAGLTYANLIPISAFRELSISGRAGGDSYSAVNSSTGLGVFDQGISDSATGTDAEGTIYTAQSQASQRSLSTEDGISVAMDVSSGMFMNWNFPASLNGPLDASASSTFESSFLLDETSTFTISGLSRGFFAGPGHGGRTDFQVQLSSPSGFLLDTNSGRQLFNAPFSVIALPDTYTLRVFYDVHPERDPYGDIEFGNFDLDLKATSVPETGSTLLMMLGGLAALIVGVRKFEGNHE